ncbi:hypothetical protein EI42_05632 [Thermosporothrix hazakensis]|jgi:hypothetical protein|uniref:Uncharacterized protein n=1 Tax=Thermosporothrix hazakensis TaxID=644383 RepID=A0A326TW07_THEHA|nr:hypothetical protein EI42_05632 [Thermosporothrix hazakensis]
MDAMSATGRYHSEGGKSFTKAAPRTGRSIAEQATNTHRCSDGMLTPWKVSKPTGILAVHAGTASAPEQTGGLKARETEHAVCGGELKLLNNNAGVGMKQLSKQQFFSLLWKHLLFFFHTTSRAHLEERR